MRNIWQNSVQRCEVFGSGLPVALGAQEEVNKTGEVALTIAFCKLFGYIGQMRSPFFIRLGHVSSTLQQAF